MALQASIQKLLARELSARTARNPNFSLRAFANYLDISPSMLSRMLRGERSVSLEKWNAIAERLQISKNDAARLMTQENLSTILEPSAIDAIHRDWVGLAILELIATKDFQAKESWLAKRLGVSIHRVRAQVDLLKQLGFLLIDEKGQWIDHYVEASLLNEKATSSARQHFLKERLELARKAVDEIPFEQRDHSGLSVAMNAASLAKARKILSKCRKDLLKLSATSEKEDVYHLDLALYPVTQRRKHT